MSVNLLDWRSATALVNKQKSTEPFISNRIFTVSETHLTKNVDWEFQSGSDKIAQFTREDDPAHIVGHRSGSVLSLKLPETNEAKFFRAADLFRHKGFGDGNMYAGNLTQITDLRNQKIAGAIQDLRDRAIRRREEMASSALQGNLSYTDAENGYAFTINFGYVNDVHLITNAGNDLWDDTDVDIAAQFRAHGLAISRRCGLAPDMAIMGEAAAEAFVKDADVMKELNNLNYQVGQLQLNQAQSKVARRLGVYQGIECWVYNQTYTNKVGTVVNFLAPKKVVFVATASPYFKWHKGPMYRTQAGIILTDLFSRTRDVEDPDGTWIDVSQCCAPCNHDPDAVICATVLA